MRAPARFGQGSYMVMHELRFNLHITIQKDHHFTTGLFQAQVAHPGPAEIGLSEYQAHMSRYRPALQVGPGPVGGAIIDHKHFQQFGRVIEPAQRLETGGIVRAAIVDRDDHTDARLRWRFGAHTLIPNWV